MNEQLLKGKYALVTGASRGIGAAIAKELARRGAHVIQMARTIGGMEDLDDVIRSETGAGTTIIPQDLAKLDALDSLGPQLHDKFGSLDIFIANAAILGSLTPVAHADPKEWQKVMDINVHANQRLIRTLDPLLRGSDAGRAVFISSGMGTSVFKGYWAEYAASKAALSAMVRCYAEEVATTNLKVNLVRPGVIDTAMVAKAYPGGAPFDLKSPEDVAPAIADFAGPDCITHGEFVDLFL